MVDRKKTTKKTAKKSPPKTKNKANTQARKEQIKLIAGFVLLAVSIYLLFAFGSFLFNAGADQSKLQI